MPSFKELFHRRKPREQQPARRPLSEFIPLKTYPPENEEEYDYVFSALYHTRPYPYPEWWWNSDWRYREVLYSPVVR
ncbi:hypothetical protein HYT33_03305 [Candidatus Roizmanbacteria bacterium]|nr:hypothetical protein [Candidatus Roizmanbacteria bacterium]